MPGPTVVRASSRHRGRVEGIHGRVVARFKRHVRRAIRLLAGALRQPGPALQGRNPTIPSISKATAVPERREACSSNFLLPVQIQDVERHLVEHHRSSPR